jgi:hypothetical protein
VASVNDHHGIAQLRTTVSLASLIESAIRFRARPQRARNLSDPAQDPGPR